MSRSADTAETTGTSASERLADERMVSAEIFGFVRERDVETGAVIRTIRNAEALTMGVDVWEDLIVIGASNAATVRDLETGERRFEIAYDSQPMRSRISGDGRFMVSTLAGDWIHIHVVQVEHLLDLADDRVTRWLTDRECQEFFQGSCPERPS